MTLFRAMGVLNPITNIVRSFAFIIMGAGLSMTGNYHLAYGMVAVLSVIGIILVACIDEKQIGKIIPRFVRDSQSP